MVFEKEAYFLRLLSRLHGVQKVGSSNLPDLTDDAHNKRSGKGSLCIILDIYNDQSLYSYDKSNY
jgi:hypothetical protein